VLTFRKFGSTAWFPAAFMRHDVRELTRFPDEGSLVINIDLVKRLSPDSLSLSEFRSPADIVIAERMSHFPLLGQEIAGLWRVEFHREFDMTDDAYLFHKERRSGMVPLYEGKMVWQFDAFYSEPRFFVSEREARNAVLRNADDLQQELDYQGYRLAYRDVAANTNERTMIAAVLPRNVFAGNTLRISSTLSERQMFYLTSVMNSLVFDWLIRLKVTTHCSIFYVYQMPVPRLQEGDPVFEQLVTRAAKLICTRSEFDKLGRDVGFNPQPAAHDEAERSQIRAEIDAIVAHLYGITEDELRHILGTFPIVPAATKGLVLETFQNWKPPSNDPLVQLIEAGESLRVEFKSSARWDYQRKQVNKELELIVVKTIAAFMNSEGGTLLIGVADDRTVLGLDPDYATIGKRNADVYENWLMTRLLESMGRDRTRLLHVSFRKIEGKEICRVDVERSRRPVFVNDDKNIERLYVRAGNSTRELSVSEAVEYSREHFSERVPAPGAQPVKDDDVANPPPTGKQSHLLPPRAVETRSEPNLGSHGLFRMKSNEPHQSEETGRTPLEDMAVEDILPLIREVVSTAEAVDREEAIREIARRLGAERTGSRIRASIESALNAASRRYIIYSDSGGLRPYRRTIDQYKRDDLKNVLRAVIGRTWTDEDEAIRAATRYLGFRRTGSQIDRAFRSAINGGLRQGLLERDGRMLRASS
jgi:hypothetical protein